MIESGELGYLKYGSILFCCRESKMRPQGAYYSSIPVKMHHLFNMCGGEREVSLGNPKIPLSPHEQEPEQKIKIERLSSVKEFSDDFYTFCYKSI